MKSIINIIFIVGLCLVIIGYYENNINNPIKQIEYRYIPKNYIEYQMEDQNLTNKYSDLFNNNTLWIRYPF